jgi:hypothetical protein
MFAFFALLRKCRLVARKGNGCPLKSDSVAEWLGLGSRADGLAAQVAQAIVVLMKQTSLYPKYRQRALLFCCQINIPRENKNQGENS